MRGPKHYDSNQRDHVVMALVEEPGCCRSESARKRCPSAAVVGRHNLHQHHALHQQQQQLQAVQLQQQQQRQQQLFMNAARNGDLFLLKRIVPDGCINVNVFDADGQTALTQGCLRGDLELVKFLVKSGADVRLANRAGWSALHIATFVGNLKLMTYLIRTIRNSPHYPQTSVEADNGYHNDRSMRDGLLTPPPEMTS